MQPAASRTRSSALEESRRKTEAPTAAAKPELPTSGSHATSWTTSPHSGGAWSFPRVGAPKDVAQALAAPLGRLSIAGEATSPQFFGTLHGAVESGQRAAAEVLGSS